MKRTVTLLSFAAALAFQPLTAGNPLNGEETKNTGTKVFRLPAGVTEKDYVPGTIIFKLKPQYRSKARTNGVDIDALGKIFTELKAGEVAKIYPRHQPPAQERNALGIALVDLSLIYEFKYTSGVPVEKAINRILATGMVEYAEPHYIYFTGDLTVTDVSEDPIWENGKDGVDFLPPFLPNDPDLTNANSTACHYIRKIKCDSAWGINTTTARGDTNVVIGIVDSGCDWDHPDCMSNWKRNMADPINGVDDDGDGYLDNYRGWDVSQNDNDPMNVNSTHGSHVAGLAAASTNNGTGVAGTGFKCKFLPIKAALDASTTTIDNGYPGIVYAADHGCKVINCSWGGSGGGSYGQDIVKYAAINKDVTVVASAGNDNLAEAPKYPAAFDFVLSVANTTSTDVRSASTTVGTWVDVSAPGTNVRSTIFNNTYGNMTGTSMAGPVTAGAVGVVRSFYPSMNALQAAEQIRVTTDYIYNIGTNASLKDKLGTGRVNLYRALSGMNKPSIRMSPINITDGNDNAFVANDTLKITGNIINYLAATTNLKAILTVTNTAVTIINPTITVGVLNTLSTYTVNTSNQWRVRINPSAPVNGKVDFRIVYTDGTNYSDYQYFSAIVNVDYINININDIGTTTTSKSAIGWNDVNGQTQGLGFMYKDSTLLYEGGLMVGVSSTAVSDNIRGAATGAFDTDFQSIANVTRLVPAVKSDFDTYGRFRDNGAGSTPLPITVTHRSFAWSQPVADRKYVIFEYYITNKGGSALNNLYAGIFGDWDVTAATFGANKGDADMANRIAYIYSDIGSKLYAGIRLLTPGPFIPHAIDNDGTGGSVNIYDGYPASEKYTTLSTSRPQSGSATGGDLSYVVSTGPFTVNPNDSVKVAFALLAGDNATQIKQTGTNAQVKYDLLTGITNNPGVTNKFSLAQNYPNPVNSDETIIGFSMEEKSTATLTLYNVMGQKVMTVVNTVLGEGYHQYKVNVSGLKDGIYYYQLSAGDKSSTRKMTISR